MHTGSPPARTALTVLALVTALLALILGGAAPAFAHAGLSSADPVDGSVLATAPQQVTLTFTESVSFSEDSLRVLSPDNERANPRPAQHVDGKGNTARVELSGELPEGTYTVAWRVVSADGHPISGAFVFSIGAPSETAAVVASGPPEATAASRLHGFFRYAAYSGLALLVGATAFVLVCWPAAGALRPVRRLLAIGWSTLLLSTVALLLLRGPYETAGPLTSAFDPAQLGRTLTGRPGLALAVRLVLLALTAVLLRRSVVPGRPEDDGPRPRGPGGRVRLAGAALALGLAFTWAAAEHAAAGIQVPLAVPVAVLHLLAMGIWLGGLITLLTVLRRRAPGSRDIPAPAIGRFSTLAFTAVAVLAGTGMYQSWRQVGSWEALFTTSFGRILIVKLVAVALVLAAAAFSRRWTARLVDEATPSRTTAKVPESERVRVLQPVGAPAAPRAGGDNGPAGSEGQAYRRSLRRTVTVEAALSVGVLVITTLLTGTQPSRAAAETAAAATAQEPPAKVVMLAFDMGSANHQGTVQITLAPGRVGENTVEAVVYTADGGFATVPELRLTLTQDELGIGPLDAKLKDQKGHWAAYDLRLPMPGVWTLDVTVRTTEIDQVTVSETVRIASPPR
ncbi:copper resistance protein CopC [Streptomyces xanthophaeus]|uniref:copper resistance CopC/CopD family protein n=1 Tax=Streptomyces xanthophaeus TaxID=67385 RepID=UPI00386C806C|nr:copper resistance protein CopC [Streptomyces xanthophaeus]WST64458.1 copper resistance protein CopC [Streptomyces xanthophaeus]